VALVAAEAVLVEEAMLGWDLLCLEHTALAPVERNRNHQYSGYFDHGILKGGGITVPLTSCMSFAKNSLLPNNNKNCQLSYS